jgi:two-component system, cell cycle sensor histidine kinase and response regulator CckA
VRDPSLTARLADILETSTDFVGMADADGRTLFVNRAGKELLGIALDEDVTGKPIASYHSPDSAALVLEHGIPAAIEHGVWSSRNTVRHRRGHDIPVSQLLLAHKDAQGQVAWFSTVARDIREQTLAEDHLRQSQGRFRALIDNLHVGVLVQDQNARIVLSNAKALELLGLTLDQLLGRTSFDPTWNVVHEDGSDFPGPTHPVPVALATGKPVHNVTMGVYRPALRDRVWLLVNAEPELAQDGSVVQVVCTFSDITDRKQLESSLLQSQKLEAVGRLAGGVAHDFNNLLTVIMGNVDLASTSMPPDSTQHQELRVAFDACTRAAALTRQLLAFARRDIISPAVVNLSDVVRGLEPMFRRLIGEHITVQVQVSSALWSVRVDPGQIQQVVLNLAINARDAMQSGGSLTLETANVVLGEDYARTHADVAPGEYAMLAVSDTGQGIPKHLQAHVFEPFFTTKAAGEGTGLGLATVHGIVRHHGGHVWLYSEPGSGTTFKVYFPRTSEEIQLVATPDLAAPTPTARATIILVEDEALVRGFAARVLEKHGHRVLAFGDPRAALRFVDDNADAIDLLLTDVVLPHMSGRQLAERLASRRPDLRVLYVSGYTQNTIVHHGVLDAGISFLAKPYTPADLLNRVQEVLAHDAAASASKLDK